MRLTCRPQFNFLVFSLLISCCSSQSCQSQGTEAATACQDLEDEVQFLQLLTSHVEPAAANETEILAHAAAAANETEILTRAAVTSNQSATGAEAVTGLLQALEGVHATSPAIVTFDQTATLKTAITRLFQVYAGVGVTSPARLRKPVGQEAESVSGTSMSLGVAAVAVVALQALLLIGLVAIFYLESQLLKPYVGELERWQKALLLGFMFLLTVGLGVIFVPYLIGAMVKLAVLQFDTSFIGTDVHINDVTVHPFSGRIHMTDLVVDNPELVKANHWKSPYLFKADSMNLQVSIPKIILSFGATMKLNSLAMDGIRVIVEEAPNGDSNVGEVIDFLSSAPSTGREYEVKKVDVTDIKAKATGSTVLALAGWITVADVHFDDLSKLSMDDLVGLVLETVLQNSANAVFR